MPDRSVPAHAAVKPGASSCRGIRPGVLPDPSRTASILSGGAVASVGRFDPGATRLHSIFETVERLSSKAVVSDIRGRASFLDRDGYRGRAPSLSSAHRHSPICCAWHGSRDRARGTRIGTGPRAPFDRLRTTPRRRCTANGPSRASRRGRGCRAVPDRGVRRRSPDPVRSSRRSPAPSSARSYRPRPAPR